MIQVSWGSLNQKYHQSKPRTKRNHFRNNEIAKPPHWLEMHFREKILTERKPNRKEKVQFDTCKIIKEDSHDLLVPKRQCMDMFLNLSVLPYSKVLILQTSKLQLHTEEVEEVRQISGPWLPRNLTFCMLVPCNSSIITAVSSFTYTNYQHSHVPNRSRS